MITQHYNPIDVDKHLLRQIEIKKNQLKIAQESNMIYVAEVLQSQLVNLQHQLSQPQISESQDPEIQALMSLLDD